MKFTKGESGNIKGKPKGTLNKDTLKGRELFLQIMEKQIDNVEDALNDVLKENPAKYLDILSKLFKYFMPEKMDLSTNGKDLIQPQIIVNSPEIAKDLQNFINGND
jgi:hypothetical protein